jgi:hypothetical protein
MGHKPTRLAEISGVSSLGNPALGPRRGEKAAEIPAKPRSAVQKTATLGR